MLQRSWKIPAHDLHYANQELNEMTHLAVKLADRQSLNKVIENWKKEFMGLRVKTDGKYLYPTDTSFQVIKLPNNIVSCHEACDYIYDNHCPDWSQRMASIGYSDNNIAVVSTNHILADGGFLLYALDHCLDDNIKAERKFPETVKEDFSQIFSKLKLEKNPNFDIDDLSKLDIKNNDIKVHIKRKAESYDKVIPAKSILCYDSKQHKVIGLNDSLDSACVLSMMALSKKQDHFGLFNLVDYRRFLKPEQINMRLCNHFAILKIVAPNITLKNTISEMNHEFRRVLHQIMTTDEVYKEYLNPIKRPYPSGATCELSNLGPIRMKPPIEDFWTQSSSSNINLEGNLYFLSYSKLIGNRNDLVIKLTFDQDSIPSKCGKKLLDSVVYTLQQISPQTKISDALQQIRNFTNTD